MKIGYYAPLPPAKSGVTDYAADLLAALRARHEVVVDASGGMDWRVYHVGNNDLHWRIYQRALREKGLVILHDAVLHHLLLGKLSRDEYVEEFVYNYGAWHRETAARLWERRGQSAADPAYFARPMLKRLVEGAECVVVHNRAAARLVREHGDAARVEVIPHYFRAPRTHWYWEVDQYRENVLGVPRNEVLFGVLGHLRESKRLDTVLRVFGDLRRQGLPVRLLLQGEFVGPDLERALGPLLEQEGIVRRGYLAEDEWWMMAHALDGAINLRWPSAGESSGIATRLMGIGKAVVVTRGEETAELPEVSVVKVDAGVTERMELAEMWAWLVLNKDARQAVGRHAALHVGGFHSLDLVAERLLALR
jgi:glycosyltransferase involved in cell wall biosynthesis